MKTLLIVYHSQSGTCAQLGQAIWAGASKEAEISPRLLRAWDTDASVIAQAQGVIFVLAENSGAMSGAMKDCLDRIFYPTIARDLVLPYALLLSAGNDGRSACAQAQRILSGIPFTESAEPLILRGEISTQHAEAAQDLGQAFAAGLAMGIF